MSTDLTTVRDHPAALLEATSRQHAEDNPGTRGSEDAAHLAMAADLLRAYETKHGVTFVALSNDALAAVQEAYEANDANGLRSAVSDLLGLE